MRKLDRLYENFRENLGQFIEKQCNRLSHRKQAVIVLVLFILFVFLSVYMIVNSVYEIGKEEGEKIIIEHIRRLEILPDSIHLNNQYNGGK